MELVLADEGAILDPPQPLASSEGGQELPLGAGKPEGIRGRAKLIGFLPLDDPGLCVGQ
jgi:hypothetical protein